MSKTLSREGHRQRIRDYYIANGLDGLQYHNIIELLLTYAIPRRDVKGIAYNLLNYFENDIDKLFKADVQELCRVDGVGENAALLIKLFGDLPEYIENQGGAEVTINDYASSKEFVKTHFKDVDNERLILICTDNSDRIICLDTVSSGSFSFDDIKSLRIIDILIRNKASSAIFVHATTREDYTPSDGDISFASRIYKALAPLEIRLNDYFIVGKNGTLSMCNDIRYMNCFCN